jgi:hypothetical protein
MMPIGEGANLLLIMKWLRCHFLVLFLGGLPRKLIKLPYFGADSALGDVRNTSACCGGMKSPISVLFTSTVENPRSSGAALGMAFQG